MSVPVGLGELQDEVRARGAVAYLVTVTEGGTPHVVSVATSWADDLLQAGAGRTTSANVQRRPGVTLMWPPADGSGYCLLVDGEGTVDGEVLSVRPTRAVLHRLAGTTDGPSCVTIIPGSTG